MQTDLNSQVTKFKTRRKKFINKKIQINMIFFTRIIHWIHDKQPWMRSDGNNSGLWWDPFLSNICRVNPFLANYIKKKWRLIVVFQVVAYWSVKLLKCRLNSLWTVLSIWSSYRKVFSRRRNMFSWCVKTTLKN